MKMKYLFSIILIFFGSVLYGCKSNTKLTITDVKVEPDADRELIARNVLGKKMTLSFVGDNVQVKIEDRKDSKVLKLAPNGDYTGDSFKLSVTKTNGDVSEATLVGPQKRSTPPYLVTVTVTAKKQ